MSKYPFSLRELPYEYTALEPVISKTTIEFHKDKHLNAYTNNLNDALSKAPELQNLELEEILSHLDKVPKDLLAPVTNNGGGVYNHNFYFEALTSPNTTELKGDLKDKIVEDFGSVENFIDEFKKAAATVFGSGWAWLVLKDGKLEVIKTANQETPLKDGYVPLLTIDVWEHAYYIDYQNLRPTYIEKYMTIINWDLVAERYNKAK